MGLKDLFKFKKWSPDLKREAPGKSDWPDHIITLNHRKFDKFIDKYQVSVVDFWAAWCGPCKTLAPRIRQLSKMYKGKVAFGKVNVDSERELAKRFHILGIPNLIFFSYSEKITNITGVRPLPDIQKKIDEILEKFEN
jgi:thioredoxin 1